jgi:hypothetical protein
MELPEDVVRIIGAFSKPRTRVDWRTCKKQEALLIKQTSLDSIHFLENLYYINAPQLYREIRYWPMYDRIVMIRIVNTVRNR